MDKINAWKSQQNPIDNAKFLDDEYMQTLTAKGNTSTNASMLLIKEATKKGYAEARDGDGVYINRPHQKRGVVQNGMIQTLKTSGMDVGVVVEDLPKNTFEEHSKLYNSLFFVDALCDIIDIAEVNENEKTKRNIEEILQKLWKEIGEETIQWKIRGFNGFQKEGVLRQGVHEGRDVEHRSERKFSKKLEGDSTEDKRIGDETYRMRKVWERCKTRCTPQGFGLSKQQFREFDGFMQELSYEGTQKQREMFGMWGSYEGERVLRQALSKIHEVWRSLAQEEKGCLQDLWRTSPSKKTLWETLSTNGKENNLRVRKLTALECWRLMSVDDEYFYKAQQVSSDVQLYKQAGNAIVVDVFANIVKSLI